MTDNITEPKQFDQQNGDDQVAKYVLKEIFLKDASFESPHAPSQFQRDWRPQINLQITVDKKELSSEEIEVLLRTTATAKVDDRVAYIAEVFYGMRVAVQNITGDALHEFVHVACPNLMYPYARELVSDLVRRGGFPQLVLMPINFRKRYESHLKQKQNA